MESYSYIPASAAPRAIRIIAVIHELPDCLADARTTHEAPSNLATVIDEWIEVTEKDRRAIS